MNIKKKAYSFVILMLLSINVHANESSGYLERVFINQDGILLFRLTNAVNHRPKCAINADWDYKINLNEPHAKYMLEMLMLSEKQSKPLQVGYGAEPDCGTGFPAINVHYLYIVKLHNASTKSGGNYKKNNK